MDVTPRRLQSFRVQPGRQYGFTVTDVGGARLQEGTVTAGTDGLVTVSGVQVRPAGVRLTIEGAGPGP